MSLDAEKFRAHPEQLNAAKRKRVEDAKLVERAMGVVAGDGPKSKGKRFRDARKAFFEVLQLGSHASEPLGELARREMQGLLQLQG